MKLSICIATLNRADFIGATLDSIVSQVSGNVEIVIVDGASTDNTQEIVTGYQVAYPFIRYERLLEKGGLDRDYTRAAEIANGEYCWFFSDDDILLPGALGAVLSSLSPTLDLIVVNSEVRSVDLSTILKARALEVDSDVTYHPDELETLFRDTASYLSFIGGVVIRKACWDERNKADYFGSWFVHMGVIFQQALHNDALVLSEPYIAIRYGNATWSSKSFEISLFKWPSLIWSFSAFSDSTRRSITPPEPWVSAKTLFIFRARGAYGKTQYEQYLKPRMQFGLRRMVAHVITAVPELIANTALVMYFFIANRVHANADLQLTDLRTSTWYYRKVAKKYLSVIATN